MEKKCCELTVLSPPASAHSMRPRRAVSAVGMRRPESEFSRHRKGYDNNPRYKGDNVLDMELDMPERTTQDYEGAAMSQRVQAALNAALAGDEEEVEFSGPQNMPNLNPYLNYNADDGNGGHDSRGDGGRRDRPKSAARKKSSRSKKSSRHRSSRNTEADVADPSALLGNNYQDEDSAYPSVSPAQNS